MPRQPGVGSGAEALEEAEDAEVVLRQVGAELWGDAGGMLWDPDSPAEGTPDPGLKMRVESSGSLGEGVLVGLSVMNPSWPMTASLW
ncbi:hypothetical protein D9T14_08215 [Propionibacterium australiense]|uniref:Uncharacterized protein n=1 Tax=Propionibacterium australiense TaxID=119981 RepID=A0A8B3FKA6_9ACTN|nr:hypothetical protein D7U36_10395 [Propionibacterium australiense]RLP08784.1 hypothetical protein D9T14_08215 [Propionibacterium australiense]